MTIIEKKLEKSLMFHGYKSLKVSKCYQVPTENTNIYIWGKFKGLTVNCF